MGQAISLPGSASPMICFVLVFSEKSTSARNKFATKTNLAVSSIEFCQPLFDERNIGFAYTVAVVLGR